MKTWQASCLGLVLSRECENLARSLCGAGGRGLQSEQGVQQSRSAPGVWGMGFCLKDEWMVSVAFGDQRTMVRSQRGFGEPCLGFRHGEVVQSLDVRSWVRVVSGSWMVVFRPLLSSNHQVPSHLLLPCWTLPQSRCSLWKSVPSWPRCDGKNSARPARRMGRPPLLLLYTSKKVIKRLPPRLRSLWDCVFFLRGDIDCAS